MQQTQGFFHEMRLNLPAAIVLLVLPVVVAAATVWYGMTVGIDWAFIALAVVGYYGSNISVGIWLHRYFSHQSYKMPRWMEWVAAFFTAGTLQGPILAWASDHARHHTFTDEARDPHSPLAFQNPWMGFFWSHIGWMLFTKDQVKSIDRATLVKWGRSKPVMKQMEYYWRMSAFMNIVPPALLGLAVWGGVMGAVGGILAIGVGRAIQQEITFFVNSLCHFFGKRPYQASTACDVWWLAPFLLGENWHNFHHAFARDYRNGHKWFHFDVHKWIIQGMGKLGLATDLHATSDERIAAKMEDTARKVAEAKAEVADQLEDVRSRLELQTAAVIARVTDARESAARRYGAARDAVKAGWQDARSEALAQLDDARESLSDLMAETELRVREARVALANLSDEARSRAHRAKQRVMDAAIRANQALHQATVELVAQPQPALARA